MIFNQENDKFGKTFDRSRVNLFHEVDECLLGFEEDVKWGTAGFELETRTNLRRSSRQFPGKRVSFHSVLFDLKPAVRALTV